MINQKDLLKAKMAAAGVPVSAETLDEIWRRGIRVIESDSVVTNAETLGQAIHEELCHNLRPLHSHAYHSADSIVMNLRVRK